MSHSEMSTEANVLVAPGRAARLGMKLDLLSEQSQQAAKRLFTHQQFDKLFPEYLCGLHTTIRASVPLLQRAQQKCLEIDDAACQILGEYYAEHAREEAEHDVWLLEDLESLGISRQDVLERVPSTAAASLVGSQYYWIEHFHPISMLGYLVVLERPSSPEAYRRLAATWEIPESGFRTLLLHAELDGDHQAEINQVIDSLPLKPEQESMLGTSALATSSSVANLIHDIVDRFERSS